jgi:hypothetical protein
VPPLQLRPAKRTTSRPVPVAVVALRLDWNRTVTCSPALNPRPVTVSGSRLVIASDARPVTVAGVDFPLSVLDASAVMNDG